MNKITITARILLGLIFTVFGLNGFFHFMSMPPMPDAANSFLGALGATGYLFPVLKALEVAAGIALLANRFVPLALVVLAPIATNILLFHTFLTPPNPVALVVWAAGIWLAWAHFDAFRPLFEPKWEPRTRRRPESASGRSASTSGTAAASRA